MATEKTSKKTKYTLYKPEPGVQRPCAFFNSEVGCKNGDSCPFLHSAGTAQRLLLLRREARMLDD